MLLNIHRFFYFHTKWCQYPRSSPSLFILYSVYFTQKPISKSILIRLDLAIFSFATNPILVQIKMPNRIQFYLNRKLGAILNIPGKTVSRMESTPLNKYMLEHEPWKCPLRSIQPNWFTIITAESSWNQPSLNSNPTHYEWNPFWYKCRILDYLTCLFDPTREQEIL